MTTLGSAIKTLIAAAKTELGGGRHPWITKAGYVALDGAIKHGLDGTTRRVRGYCGTVFRMRLLLATALGVTLGLASCNTGPTPATPADVAGPPAEAETTSSGLAYRVLTPGTGTEHPGRTTTVTVHYSGWTTDGELFDSSVQRGSPSTFALDRVIPGWTEGVQLMVEGEQTRFWIPEELAYKGVDGRPQGTLVFDIELLQIH